jgi:hypothetical protein
MTSPAATLREHIARAFVRNRIMDNMKRWGRERDEDSIQQAVDYAWTDFLRDAEIAIAAIAASGNAVVPVEQYERMQDALEQIVSWSKAYPLNIFPEPDLKKAHELLEAGGITLDAVSAHCMRHVIDGVGKIAREAARTGPWDAQAEVRLIERDGAAPRDAPSGSEQECDSRPAKSSAPEDNPSPWEGGHHFQEEDGYPGSLVPRKRGAP